MRENILKRYPELTEGDVVFVDNTNQGGGVELSVWNSDTPKPTMEQIKQWVEEDALLPQPKSELEILKEQQSLIQQALDDLIFSGGGL